LNGAVNLSPPFAFYTNCFARFHRSISYSTEHDGCDYGKKEIPAAQQLYHDALYSPSFGVPEEVARKNVYCLEFTMAPPSLGLPSHHDCHTSLIKTVSALALSSGGVVESES